MVAIFVVLTFIIFLVVDYFVLKTQRKDHPAFDSYPVFDKRSFFLPEGVYLSRGHIWLKIMKGGLVRLGIDEFVLKAIKTIKITNILNEGSPVKKGDIIFHGQTGNHTLAFRSPVDGIVTMVNKNLGDKTVSDPYNDDWSVAIKPDELSELSTSFKINKQAINWLAEEFKRLKDFLSLHTAEPELAGLTMADGGHIIEGAVANVSEKTLLEFEKNFLTLS